MSRPIIVIPARMQSSRLPGKPLALIAGLPMIVHVWQRAMAADLGPVVVACAEEEIAQAVRAAGGTAVLTAADLPSGSDRVHAALATYDPDRRHDVVVNLQGDLPTLEAHCLRALVAVLNDPAVDIATLAARIHDAAERDNPNVVKVAAALDRPDAPPGTARDTARALYFSRLPIPHDRGGAPPDGARSEMGGAASGSSGPWHYHHIGVYGWRRAALDRFVALPPGVLELREGLEQLRALEAGMRIDVRRVDAVPLGVDTPADLSRARDLLTPR
ncbi:MAG: 3-deoxy-manno-octulosonate cytidylyltransferase [Alphaproteobacteria bacterium]